MKSTFFHRIVGLFFPQRLNRFQFIVRTLLLCNVFVILWTYMLSTFYKYPLLIIATLLVVAIVLRFYHALAIYVPRLQDIGESGWLALHLLIPYLGALTPIGILAIPFGVPLALVVGCVLPSGWSTRMRAEWERQRAQVSHAPASQSERPRVADEY